MMIAVTGGLGFIGTNLIGPLRKEFGGNFRILDNLSNPSGDFEITGDIELIEGDIRDADSVNKLVEGADAVIHLAAHTRVIDSVTDPALNFAINTIGTFNVLEAMRNNGVKIFVGASTGGAILGEVPPPINEEIAAKPASPYGASKLATEGYCWAYAQSYGIRATSLRFSNIYGPHSRNKASVVAAFIRNIKEKGVVTVYGDGSQTRDYLHVDDLTDGIINAIKNDAVGVYQLGHGEPTSLNKLIEIFKEVSPSDFDVIYENFRSGELIHTYCDISKAHAEFAFSPKVKLADGVKTTWDWFDT
jgi:UDP-glucose 4-epimerase